MKLTILAAALASSLAGCGLFSPAPAAPAAPSLANVLSVRSLAFAPALAQSSITQTVSLSGAGVALGIAPVSIVFGNGLEGQTSAAQTVTLTNPLSSALGFTATATPGAYTVTNNCGGSIPANGTCTLSVSFDPQTTGTIADALTVTLNP